MYMYAHSFKQEHMSCPKGSLWVAQMLLIQVMNAYKTLWQYHVQAHGQVDHTKST